MKIAFFGPSGTFTEEAALVAAEGQDWEVREIVVPTQCVSRGSKQAPFEYLLFE